MSRNMLDKDLARIHTDLYRQGLADSVTYTIAATSAASTITGTFAELPEPFLHDEGSEKRRRTCSFECRRSVVATPAKGDTVAAAIGAYAGTWTVIELGSSDDGGHLLTVRLDDRIKAGTGRRLP